MPKVNTDSMPNDLNTLSLTEPTTDTIAVDVTDIPLSLYIHIPWCVKKCPYCDFNSHELPIDSELSMYEEYVDALLLDAAMQQPLAQNRKIGSIFIGGGTPSLLPIAQYQRLFTGLRTCFEFAEDIEVTMEANPGTLEHAPFAQYLEVGINRLSIGVQSFAADKLKVLGRIHDPVQALSAISAAKAAGFVRVNVDLMHGLPKQTMNEALEDIQMAHDAGATHISWYQLTIEPNTGQSLLQQLGYSNYEVSAWAGESDKPCRHNINYWQFGDYLAIGAGAHGKVTIGRNDSNGSNSSDVKDKMEDDLLVASGIYRFSKSRLPKDYVVINPDTTEKSDIRQITPKMVGWQAIDQEELVSEFMLNALRLHGGVAWSLFEKRTGLTLDSIAEQVNSLVKQGLLVDSDTQLQPTVLGQRYLNQILRAFL
jgi:coproporphyrinogen III oxidase-like Fe-S oxidoreductase